MRTSPDDIRPALPEFINDESELDDVLSHPSPALIEFIIKTVAGPLVILGAAGKMGPSLAVMARRAADEAKHPLEVIAVSRFTNAATCQWLEARGVRTFKCDLLDAHAVAQLPDAASILYLVGLKFGTAQNPSNTWAMNTLVPARICERYPRSRIVALSTGNVYPLGEVSRGGSIETDPMNPMGEYPNAAVARERIFEFFSQRNGTAVVLLRLLYAVDLRYSVLVDIARAVHAGESVPLATGYFNCIWQGNASDMALRALALASSPPAVFNLCRPEIFSVRDVASRLGELLGRRAKFAGRESKTALLADAARIGAILGEPDVGLDTMLRWIAQWVKSGGRNLGRPTHFEVRDGNY